MKIFRLCRLSGHETASRDVVQFEYIAMRKNDSGDKYILTVCDDLSDGKRFLPFSCEALRTMLEQ